jgi:hypothetical protein
MRTGRTATSTSTSPSVRKTPWNPALAALFSVNFNGELRLDPIIPLPLIILLGAALIFFTVRMYLRIGVVLGWWRNCILLLFRLSGIILVLFLLLQPARERFDPPPNRDRTLLVGIDTSLSMKQRDADKSSRLDAATDLLIDAKVVSAVGVAENPRLRLFEFGGDAQPINKSILELRPKGKTTRLHQSIQTMRGSPDAGADASALILLTDGHDFELVSPAKTGAAARAAQTPIYAVAIGKQGKVRDVSTHITSFSPYCYVKQKARITAGLRVIGCEFEDLQIQLLRQGQVVQQKRINAGELQEVPLEFEVLEPETGQFEYEVRALPLENEVDPANNSAITYLNVIDQQIRVLLVEGDPYWDTTFLHRSLLRNDKFDVDALLYYGKDRVRAIRKTDQAAKLVFPETLDELSRYDVVFLGRNVERITGNKALLLDRFVQERNGTVIFGRGRAFEKPIPESDLEPVIWDEASRERVKLEVGADGRGLAALRSLHPAGGGLDAMPEMVKAHEASESRPLTATLATAGGQRDAPAIVHRRLGRGQVVSIGVEGLWRWGLNAKFEGLNSPFDRFWDQMILWLMAGRDFIPTRQFSFRPNSANIVLGEKVHFRVTLRQPDPNVKSVPLTLFNGEKEVGRLNLGFSTGDPGRLSGEFLPDHTGRYRALAKFPDGSTQESRFIVFTENLEETEVATDTVCLRRLCESSGGRLIEPRELGRLLQEISREEVDAKPKSHIEPVWNSAWVFYLAGLLFGLDWYLRRRWGLC